jgi:antirestriction protein ArdC
MTVNVYQIVTDQILEKLQQGTVPWQKPWKGGQRPTNLVSGKPYRGINVLLLGTAGFASPYWLTFKQITDLGGHLKVLPEDERAEGDKSKTGQKTTLVVFWQMLKVTDKETGDPKTIPMLRYYRVFNLEQTEDVRVPKGRISDEPEIAIDPIEAAEAIIANYPNPPKIVEAGDEAWYTADRDLVNLPPRKLFDTADEFYATAFHELGHSTGNKDRLDRLEPAFFGSHKYGREELVAEITAAFLAAEAGIETTQDNNAAYLAGWVRTIKEDIKAVVVAAGQAQKAADHIQGRTSAEATEPEPEQAVAA